MSPANPAALPGAPASPAEEDLILLGYLTRPQGHRGAIRLHPEFDDLGSFSSLKSKRLFIKPGSAPGLGLPKNRPTTWRSLTLTSSAPHQRVLVLTFEEVPDMNHAELLRGMEVYVEREHLWDLPPGKYYAWQLAGLTVHDTASNQTIGEVISLRDGGLQDFLEVRREGKSPALIPYIPQFIDKVDLDQKSITVTLPDGLLDL